MLSSSSVLQPLKRAHRKSQGEFLALGSDSAWDPESRNGEWFLFKGCLGPGAGGRLGWAARGPPLQLHPAREKGGLSRKWVNIGHLENLDFSAL